MNQNRLKPTETIKRNTKRNIEKPSCMSSIRRVEFLGAGNHVVKIVDAAIRQSKKGIPLLHITVECTSTGCIGSYNISLNSLSPYPVVNQLLDALQIKNGCEPEELKDKEVSIEVVENGMYFNILSIHATNEYLDDEDEELEEDDEHYDEDEELEDEELEDEELEEEDEELEDEDELED